MCSSIWSVQCWASALRHSCYEQACAGNNWKTASWNTPTNITSLISSVMLFFFPSNLLHFYNGFGYLSQQWLSSHKVEYLLKLSKKRGFLTNSSWMELWSNLSFILCEVWEILWIICWHYHLTYISGCSVFKLNQHLFEVTVLYMTTASYQCFIFSNTSTKLRNFLLYLKGTSYCPHH